MSVQIKLRRDTAADWTAVNPILGSGEPGLETDTLKIKYGDGVTTWTNLAYPTMTSTLTAASQLTGATLASNVLNSSLQSVGVLTNLTVTNPIVANITGNAATATTATSATASVTATTAGSATTATNIAGGIANQLLCQTAAGTTAFLAAPLLSGSFLQWNGTSFSWSTTPNVASSLSGTTLATNVVNSSLTTLGTLSGAENNYAYVALGAYNTPAQGSFSTGAVLDYSSNARISVQSGGFGVYTGGIGNTAIFSVSSAGSVTIPGSLKYSGLEFISPQYISASTSGATIPLSATYSQNILELSTTVTSITLSMPAAPADGQICQISIASLTAPSSTITFSNVTGSAIPFPSILGTYAVGTVFKYVYQASTGVWFKI
jgi:hypothetical protein